MTFDDCHRVIKKGDLIALRHALDTGEIDPNLKNRFSWTLLMLAALEGNSTIAQLLLERGAAVDDVNDFGETALSLAAHKGYIPLLRILLDRGASVDVRPHGFELRSFLQAGSGLEAAKIDSIMELLEGARNGS